MNDENVEINENNALPETEQKYKKNLVLSGGGIKGIVHVGALYALFDLGVLDKFEFFAGTSVGGLVLALYVIGYSPSELYDFVKLFDMSKLKNFSIFNITQFGLDTGTKLEYVIQRLIKGKGLKENIKLKELFDIKQKKLIFTTVCLNTMETYYLSHETHPDLPLYLAIRMSTSIPFIYCPVIYEGMHYVDGACFDNFPVQLFDPDSNDTLGLYIVDSYDKVDNINNLETYILRLLETFMKGMTINATKGHENYTVNIHVESINVINYNIDDAKKDELFLKGYGTMMDEKAKCFC